MATAADIRAATPGAPSRGNLPIHIIEAWDRDHPDDPYQPSPRRDVNGTIPDGHDEDFSEGDLEALFDESAADVPEETPPRKPPARKPAGKSRLPFTRGGKGKPKPKAKKPRASTEDLLGGLWRAAAKLAAPLPPLHRTLRIQAPIAGILLEDTVRDTVVDPLLQPLVRLTSVGKTLSALVGPPMFVTAIMLHSQQSAVKGTPPNPVLMTVATEGLRSSLMAWCDVAGPKFEIALKREKEFEEKYGQSVDDMMAFLFSEPAATAEAAAAEDEAIRRAQGIL